ncbi:DUF6804 family protein [Sinomonas soli]
MSFDYGFQQERHPAAPGFTEAQLEGVDLVTVHPAAWPASIGAAMLFLGVIGAQYDFYTALRWAVTAMAIWMAVIASGQKGTLWGVVFAAVAVLFNPLIPFYSTRGFWLPVDMAVLVLFIVAGVKLKASKPAPRP